MTYRVAVQMDWIGDVHIKGDSTFALMLEAQSRGYELYTYHPSALAYEESPGKRTLTAKAQKVSVQDKEGDHFKILDEVSLDLTEVDFILMRQDPPFDMGYITATYILEQLPEFSKRNVIIMNDPKGVRDAPEKLVAMRFPQFFPPTLVSADPEALNDFRKEHQDIIVKPLYGNGGAGIFHISPDNENFRSLLDMHFATSNEPLMIQRYEKAVRKGDKRIVLVDGKPVGALNRIPSKGDSRSNLHVGGKAEKCTLTKRDMEVCEGIGPYLRENGLVFVGIDMIGDYLTEINVTSPTGLRGIDDFDGINTAGLVWDALKTMKENKS